MTANTSEAMIQTNRTRMQAGAPTTGSLWALLIGAFILSGACAAMAAPSTVWVDDDYSATAANDGHTWAVDAFATIQEGVDAVAENGTVMIAAGTYKGAVPKKALRIEAQSGAVIHGASPALTVSFPVSLGGGTWLPNPAGGNDPAFLVLSGGALTLHNCTIQESTGADNACIELQGGTVDVGSTTAPGNNVFELNGAGQFVKNSTAGSVLAIGNTWKVDGVAVTDNFAIEDRMTHALDNAAYGLVTWVANNAYVTTSTLGVKRAIAAVPAGSIINIGAGTFVEPGQVVIGKNLQIIGSGVATTTLKTDSDTTYGGNAQTEAWVYVAPSKSLELGGLTLDAAGKTVHHALQSRGALVMHDAEVKNVKFATYAGRGVVLLGGTAAITNVTMSAIERIGIHVRGNVETPAPVATIVNCSYTGKGLGDWLDYAIEVGGGGQATVIGCSATLCKGTATTDGSTSAGVLATDYWGTGSTLAVYNSSFTGNTTGIAVGYGGTDATKALLQGNTLTGNTQSGIQISGVCTVDAGQIAPTSDITGLGVSSGGNILSGYVFNNLAPWAIDCSDAAAGAQVLAYANDFGAAASDDINLAVSGSANLDGFSQTGSLTAQAPPAVTVQCSSLIPAAAATQAEFIAQGGIVSEKTVTISSTDTTHPAGDGVVTRTYTITGKGTRSTTVNQTITVDDTIAPVIVGKDISVNLDASGNASITPADVLGSSTETCGTLTLTSVVPSTFTCTDKGENTVTLTAIDGNGNTGTCTATVTIVDATAPSVLTQPVTITLNAAGTGSITPAQVDNGSSDACGIASRTLSKDSFTFCDVGTQTVTLTVTDVNGNSSSGTASVTVNAPVDAPAVVYVDDGYTGCAVTHPAASGTFYVGYNAFTTIEAAFAAVASPGTIHVADGAYATPPIAFTKSVTIEGQSQVGVVITASSAAAADRYFDFLSPNVVLKKLTINGAVPQYTAWPPSRPFYGLNIGTATGTVLEDVTVKAFGKSGINLNGTTGATFTRVTALDNGGAGIFALDVHNITFDSIVTANNQWGGVGIATWGRYAPPAGVSGVVFTGSNNLGEGAAGYQGGLYFEEGNYADKANPVAITYGTTAGVDVQLASGMFTHTLHGPQDDGSAVTSDGYRRIRFYSSRADAVEAALKLDDAQHIVGPAHFLGLETRYVRDLADGSFYVPAGLKIETAVAAAPSASVINVANGTYVLASTLNIDKSLTISGESKAGVTINASACGNSWGVYVTANITTLKNFTVVAPPTGYAIHVAPAEPVTTASPLVQNVTLQNLSVGGVHAKTPFDLNGVDGAVLDGLTSSGSTAGFGIGLSSCKNIVVRNCTTSGNAWGGLAVMRSNYVQGDSSGISIEATCVFNETPAISLQPETSTISGVTIAPTGHYYLVDFGGGKLNYANSLNEAVGFASYWLNRGASSVTISDPAGAPISFAIAANPVQVDDNWTGLPAGTPVSVNGTYYTIEVNASATVQGGVNLVAPSGLVSVAPGAYTELVSVAKTVQLVSQSPYGAVVTAPTSAEKAALVTVNASGVGISGFDFVVNQPDASCGIYMAATSAAHNTALTVQSNRFEITGSFVNGGADAYIGFGTYSTAIAVNGIGGFPTANIIGNEIVPDVTSAAPAAMFDRAIYLREVSGTVLGNTVYGDAHDLCAQFVSYGELTVKSNSFLGKGGRDTKGAQVDFTEPNSHGSIVFTGNTVKPFEFATPSGSQHVRSLMVKNNYSGASVLITENIFQDVQEVAILLGNSKNTIITRNSFAPKAGDTSFVHVQVGNKVATSGAPAPVQMNATIQGNSFAGPGGRAIEFLNHNATGATFGSILVGGAGALANTFGAGLDRFIHLDQETQATSVSSSRPYYSQYGATVMAPFSANIDASENLYNLGSGAQLPSAMDLASLFALENKLFHAPDSAGLGLIRVKAAKVYVTTSSGSIQRGINAASTGDTVIVDDGSFNGKLTIGKTVTLLSANGSASTTILDSTATGLGTVQFVSPTTGVQIGDVGHGFTIQGIDSASPGIEYAAIYLQAAHSGTKIIGNKIVANGDAALTAEYAPVDLVITDNEFAGKTFAGANPAGFGFTDQFTLPNVPRQLVVIQSGPGPVVFSRNLISGTAGGLNTSGQQQGNTLVTIDASNATITDNSFTGVSTRYATALRIGGTATTVSGNLFAGNTPGDLFVRSAAAATAHVNWNSFNSPLAIENGSTSATLDAQNNWWGNLSGPTSPTLNLYGTGRGVAGLVGISPWLATGVDTDTGTIGFQPGTSPALNYQPVKLVFTREPAGAALGSALSTQPIVQVQDMNDAVTDWAQPDVTLALSANTYGSVLTGTNPKTAAAGVAAFDNLAVTVGGGPGLTLVAAAPSLASATSASFDISNPAPTLTSISPIWVPKGSGQFTLTLNGGNFVPTSKVMWGGSEKTPTFVNAGQLTVVIPAEDLLTAGTVQVKVTTANPAGESASRKFTITETAVPSIVWVKPTYNISDDNDGHVFGYDAFAGIQSGVNGVAALGTVNVAAGTYVEDVNLNKQVNLLGAGYASTIISGVLGGDSATVRFAASGSLLEGFTITRQGNNLTDWNNTGLNSAGAAIQGQTITGVTIQNCKFEGNRTAIDINNSNGHTISNNLIVNNRTGLVFRNQTDNITFTENEVTGNWTVGILFLDASSASNVPVQTAANCNFSNNNISGNWYGQIVDRQTGGSLPAPGANRKNFSGNWLGSTAPVLSTANSTEPGYADLIPVCYGGTAAAPGGQPDVCGPASANFDITPLLASGSDASGSEMGFQGDFSTLQVVAASAQTGTETRIQEAVSLVIDGGTLNIAEGTYVEAAQVSIAKSLDLVGAGSSSTIVRAAGNTGSGGDSQGWFLIGSGKEVNVQNLTFDGVGRQIYAAILHHGSGTISECTFSSIKHGTFEGTAIAVRTPGNVDVTECVFSQIGRNGIATYDGPTGTYSNNTYIGKGTGSWMDYAFLIQWGAAITVRDNQISDCVGVYDGWGSSGIAVWDDPGTVASIVGNTFSDNSVGVAVAVLTGGFQDSQVTIGDGNVFTGGETGVAVQNIDNLLVGGPDLDFGACTFQGQTDQAIRFDAPLCAGTQFEVGQATFKTAAGVTITDNFDKEDSLYHATDEAGAGLLVWNTENVYVTPVSASIQRAIDAASAGWTVNVKVGAYTGNVNVNKAVTVSLGASPAQVSVAGDWTMTSGSTLSMELAAAGADQLAVNGTVNLGGATLNASSSLTYPAGANVILIANDGTDPVQGTFAGLANGSTLTLNGQQFTIFYNGGDGNDVALFRSGGLDGFAATYVDDTFSNPVPGQDPDGEGPAQYYLYDSFPSVQAGVDAVVGGGTVNVAAGSYAGAVNVNKAVTLLGANAGVAACSRTGAESAIESSTGSALTISADGVVVDGFAISGPTGISASGVKGFTIVNNMLNAGLLGVNIENVAGTGTPGFTLQNNKVVLSAKEVPMMPFMIPTAGIALSEVNGTAPVIEGNCVQDAFAGYALYAVVGVTIKGGTITGVLQGVDVLNVDANPLHSGASAPSTFTVDGVSMSGFAGTATDVSRNFHAGVYVFTTGADVSKKVTGTIKNVTITGTGKVSGDSAGLYFGDFSTASANMQDITVQECTITGNLNRGINARGANTEVDVVRSTITGNGSDPFGTDGNHGFGIFARMGAKVSVTESFITNPATQAGYTVSAFGTDLGAAITASNCAIDNSGNASGRFATCSADSSINASGNAWGEVSDTVIAGLITGSIDFTPYLNSNADIDSGTAGFQGDFSSLHVSALGIQAAGTRIQEGISLLSGTKVLIEPGNYVENVVANKDGLELAGAGQSLVTIVPAISAPNSGAGSLPPGASHMILVRANNVKIHGMTLDGNNPALTSGVVAGGADIDARNGIITDHSAGVWNNLEVYDSTVKNIYLRGIYASSGGSFNFHHNNVRNVQGEAASIGIMVWASSGVIADNIVSEANDAIAGNHSTGTQFLRNTVTASGSGVHTDNNGSSGGVADLLEGNNVSAMNAGGYGVWVFAPYRNVEVKGNTISGCSVGLCSAGTMAAVTPVFQNNSVTLGNGAESVGVYETTSLFGWGSAAATAAFANNAISGVTYGFYLEAESGYNLAAHIGDNNTVTGNEYGVYASGALAKVKVQNNILTDNGTAAILAEGGAIIDAGQCGTGASDITGLGISAGGNTMTGYGSGKFAIANSGTPAVLAFANNFGAVADMAPFFSGAVEYSQSGAVIVSCPAAFAVQCSGDITGGATDLAGFLALGGKVSATAATVAYSDSAAPAVNGTVTRTYTITDKCGLSAQCTQTITVTDTVLPIVTAPANVTVGRLASADPWATGTATATDHCTASGALAISYTDNRDGLTGPNATGDIVRTWKAVDAAGNAGFATQTITIEDTTAPVLSVVNVTTNTTGACEQNVVFGPTAVDVGYFQGFEEPAWVSGAVANAQPSVDWNDYDSQVTRVTSGAGGIVSKTGGAHAMINSVGLSASASGAYTRLGGYSGIFGDGFRAAVDIYINLADPQIVNSTPTGGYGWDLSTAIDQAGLPATHRRDFIFHTAAYGPDGVIVAGSNTTGAPGKRRNDLLTINHYKLAESGWYTFEWVFRNNGSGVLAVDLNLKSANGALLWTQVLSNPADLVSAVGGNRYMMFFPYITQTIPIDNTTLERFVPVVSMPASGSSFAVGTTAVDCTATDALGNVGTSSFTVTVGDGQAPIITGITATELQPNVVDAVNVKDSVSPVVQGTVKIAVNATDQCPLTTQQLTINLVNGANSAQLSCVSQDPEGTFNFEWPVTAATAQGTWTATVVATDTANSTPATFTMIVDKSQIAGQLTLQGFLGTGTTPLHSRMVKFVATGTTGKLKEWNVTLSNDSGATFNYTLAGVPPGTTGLSAKTDWNLRRKLPVTLDANSQAAVDFTEANMLKAGDIAPATRDNIVQLMDYLKLLSAYNKSPLDPAADINGDGMVQTIDYLLMSGSWYTQGDQE